MVKIRLQRIGTKKRPFYRVIAADSRKKRDGSYLEILGQYQPLLPKDARVNLKSDRIAHWLGQGAQPTEIVQRILREQGIQQSQ